MYIVSVYRSSIGSLKGGYLIYALDSLITLSYKITTLNVIPHSYTLYIEIPMVKPFTFLFVLVNQTLYHAFFWSVLQSIA